MSAHTSSNVNIQFYVQPFETSEVILEIEINIKEESGRTMFVLNMNESIPISPFMVYMCLQLFVFIRK